MNANVRMIEVDAATAERLAARAAESGVSVAELVAALAASDAAAWSAGGDAGPTASGEPSEDLSELDRRWAAVQTGEATVPHEEVVRWLETWGTPRFTAWSER
jgi:hypothetical protein